MLIGSSSRIKRTSTSSHLEFIRGAGHMLHYVHLDRIIAAIDGMSPAQLVASAQCKSDASWLMALALAQFVPTFRIERCALAFEL